MAVRRAKDVHSSITIRQPRSLRHLIDAIPADAWTPIPYWLQGDADVAETTYTPFQGKRDAVPFRRIAPPDEADPARRKQGRQDSPR